MTVKFYLLFIFLISVNGLSVYFTDYPAEIIYINVKYNITWNSDFFLVYTEIELWQYEKKLETLYVTDSNERSYSLSLDEIGTNYSLLLKGTGIIGIRDRPYDEEMTPEFMVIFEDDITEDDITEDDISEDDTSSSSFKWKWWMLSIIGGVLFLSILCLCKCCSNCFNCCEKVDVQEVYDNRPNRPNIKRLRQININKKEKDDIAPLDSVPS